MNRDTLSRVLHTPHETLEPLLRALVTLRQVVVIQVGGELLSLFDCCPTPVELE